MGSQEATGSLTRELVRTLIIHRLKKAGYEDLEDDWNSDSGYHQYHSHQFNLVLKTLKHITEEFINSYNSSFDDMTGPINVHGDDLKEVMYKIFDVTLETGIQWGRLVGLFVFASKLCVKAMDCNRADVVDNIINRTSDYLQDTKVTNWVNLHGGWDGFVKFYKKPEEKSSDDIVEKASRVLGGVMTVFGILIG